MKETKEMMKILSQNKKRVQEREKNLKVTKKKAKDITGAVWMCVFTMVIISIIAQI